MSIYNNKDKTLRISNRGGLKQDVLIYSILFLVTALGCYIFFIFNGKTFIKYDSTNMDGFTQIYTTYVSLKHMIKNLFAGNGISGWAWSLGLGGDTFEYYGFKLFNPLTYFVIAFPERLIDVGYSIANVIREYLAGFTFLLCMREVKLDKIQRIAGAMTYAFCGWIVEIVLNQGNFENIVVIFPLLIMGTERLLKQKSPTLFIVSVAICIMTGVTWTYICGILIVLYYFARYHDYHRDEPIKQFVQNTLKFIANGLKGIVVAFPFVISMILSMGGATTDTGAETNLWAYPLKKYLSIPGGLFKYSEVGAVSYSYICMSVLCVALIPILLLQMKRKSTTAWFATSLFVLSLLPITSKVFNGLSYPAGRWYFALMFFLIWATIECLNEEVLSNKKNLRIMACWLLGLLACIILLYISGLEKKGTLYVVIVEVSFGMILILIEYLYYYRKKTDKWILTIAAMIFIAGLMVPVCGRTCPLTGGALDDYLNIGESYERVQTASERVVPQIRDKDKSFFRVDQAYRLNKNLKSKLKVNNNIVFDNNSIYIYSSLIDSKWNEFNKILGNNYGYFSRITVISNDNRPAMDYLLGVKYFLGKNKYEKKASRYAGYGYEKSDRIDGVTIHKKKQCIGLGTAMSQYITESELMEYPQLVRDQVMLQAAVIPDDEVNKVKGVKHASKKDIETRITKLKAKVKAGKNLKLQKTSFTVSKEKGTIKIKYPKVKDALIMVSIKGLEREKLSFEEALKYGANGVSKPKTNIAKKVEAASYRDQGDFRIKIKSNGIKKYAYCEKNSPRGFNDIGEYNINMGRAENLGKTINLKFRDVGTYNFDSINVYAIPMDVLNENAAELEKNSFVLDEPWDNKNADIVTGRVNVKKNSILYLSIPYDKGWHVNIDDSLDDAKTIKTNIAFTGTKISQGEHEVWLEYTSRSGNSVGIFMCCWIGSLLGFIIRKRVIEKDIDETEKILQKNKSRS